MGKVIWLASIILLLALPGSTNAAIPDTLPDNTACFRCHMNEGAIKRFENDESVSTRIDPAAYKRSVHGNMPCTDCHEGYTPGHPIREYRGLKPFRVRTNRVCRTCHDRTELAKHTVHAVLLEKEETGEALLCSGCHGAHTVTAVKGGNLSRTVDISCMQCHAQHESMTFVNGDERSTRVNLDELSSSPHRELGCLDCHHGFSSTEHPHRRFRTERDFHLASAEICKRCHFDKFTKLRESIHYEMLRRGKPGPTCTDCHGAHATTDVNRNRLATVQKCRKCHERIYEVYGKSVHGTALVQEHNQDVPICIDCHTAHSVQDPLSAEYHEQIPDTCSSCHANAALMQKYGISTNVVKTYLSDFHGVALSLYKDSKNGLRHTRPIAVCTDCHGTHDISRLSALSHDVLRQKLIARCRTCHNGANENFPDAWLSHYEPSLKKTPIVYLTEMSYKILLPLMVIGIVLQVFLHIWRYLVNR